ncbi:hypothetical protein [Rickettsiales endosymbiont of Stachyamoeba lipophora]|nr:hypothetical protein [Rickettsiales endosymbiont of Stachyamoeba lipophora]AZL15623.1 hypothetical protein EF513_03545 [Rickettsiales endosymbiont of Stachyamoeba lipophora]
MLDEFEELKTTIKDEAVTETINSAAEHIENLAEKLENLYHINDGAA